MTWLTLSSNACDGWATEPSSCTASELAEGFMYCTCLKSIGIWKLPGAFATWTLCKKMCQGHFGIPFCLSLGWRFCHEYQFFHIEIEVITLPKFHTLTCFERETEDTQKSLLKWLKVFLHEVFLTLSLLRGSLLTSKIVWFQTE